MTLDTHGASVQQNTETRIDITPLMDAQRIAIVGASNDPRKIGGRPIAYMLKNGFKGSIFPVNPTQSEVQGLKTYASLSAIGEQLDQVIVALPGAAVEAVVSDALCLNARSIVILSAGFGEIDQAGMELQQRIADRCVAANVPLLGPNCIGLVNAHTAQFSTFMSAIEHRVYPSGDVAIVSQSGAIGSYLYGMAGERGVRVSHFVATGNEAGVDVADCIAWLAKDARTRVIMAYMEGCRDGKRLREALLAAFNARKPVIIMKAGSSDEGAAAAASHTGSLAGSDAVFNAIFSSFNAQRVYSMQEMCDLAYACSVGGMPRGNRLGVITQSGGVGVIATDAASGCGLTLPKMPVEAQQRIQAIIPFSTPSNPIDTTAQTLGDRTLLTRIMEIVFQNGEFDSILSFNALMGQSETEFGKIKSELFRLRKLYPERLVIFGSRAIPAVVEELNDNGILYFDDPTQAVMILGRLVKLADGYRSALETRVCDLPAVELPSGPIDEAQARDLLESTGLPFVPQKVAKSLDECIAYGESLGFPLAAKILSPEIAHKSDVGGVRLNIADLDSLSQAWVEIMANVERNCPGATIHGILLSPMVQGGVEIALGVTRDPVFGPMVMCGLGGVFVEIFKDVAFRPAPVTRTQALQMINGLKGLPLLKGARGKTPVDIDALANAIVSLADFAMACGESLESVEINPYIALPNGGWAVDALIVPSSNAACHGSEKA